ncbi:MAG: DUF7133 domain-containing protein [Verrucomicrobiales bacterium]
MMRRLNVLMIVLSCLWARAEDPYGSYELGEGNEIVVSEGVIIRELPAEEKGKLPLLAVGMAKGANYLYDPNGKFFVGIWTGHFGRQDPGGAFEPMNERMKSFGGRRNPWLFSEPLRLSKKLKQEQVWKGLKVTEGKVRFLTELSEEVTGMRWEIAEWLEYESELAQTLHFEIKANQKTEENLNYLLDQVGFRRVSTNGKQNQRGGIKNLFPNQEHFTISFERRPERGFTPVGYRVEEVAMPELEAPFLFEPTDLAFTAEGVAYVTTRTGAVWKREGEEWTLFAEGLQEANGVLVAEEEEGIYVMQKPELTFLKDLDGDGRADLYRTVEDRFRFTGNYHEFAYGPRRDGEGNLYFALGLAARGYHQVKGEFQKPMSTPLGYRGWVMKVDPEGRITPFASGLRSPAGIGMNAENELFVTDNQGDWVASSYLGHVEEGDFLGHPAALWDLPEYGLTPKLLDHRTVAEAVAEVPELDQEKFARERKHPAVWLAHGDLTNSPGHPAFAPQEGFGPFGGQAFIADIAQRTVVRVSLEKVDGAYQGAVYPFIRPLKSAAYSAAFDPEGHLWVGSVGRGWVAGEPALEKITFDEKAEPFEIHRITLTDQGFDLVLTAPMAARGIAAEEVKIKQFHYKYWDGYGSEPMGETALTPERVSVSEDGRRVSLEFPRLEAHLYHIELPRLKAAGGQILENNYGIYTLNKLRP